MYPLLYLNKFFLKYKIRLLLGFLFVVASNLFVVFPAIVVRDAFNELINVMQLIKTQSHFSADAVYDIIFSLFLLLIATALLRGVFVFLMRQTLVVMSRHIEYDLKNEIFSKLLTLDISFFNNSMTGDLISRVSEDINKIRMYLGPAIMYSINITSMLGIIFYHMFSVSVKYSLLVLMPMPLLVFFIYMISNMMNKKNERVQNQLAHLNTFCQETYSGIKILKSYNKETKWMELFSHEVKKYFQYSVNLISANSLFFPFILLLIGSSSVITIFLGIQEVKNNTISPGIIAEFLIYTNMITWPVASIGWIISLTQRAASAQKRFNKTISIRPKISEIDGAETATEKPEIVFKNIGFKYDNDSSFELKNLNLTIPYGEKLAISGKIGSGKSTIGLLIARLFDVNRGDIMVNGKNIKSLNLSSWTKKIGFVPQDTFLFSDTIENNIKFGANSDTEIDTKEIARMACVHENIMHFPEQYQTRIGERGVTLSGGQKQRISIARAIAEEHDIFIFDDCFSAVDTQTEKEILYHLENTLKEKTVILICHRISSIKNFDRIIIIEDGEISEAGNHDTLIKKQGAYYKMFEQQKDEETKAFNH